MPEPSADNVRRLDPLSLRALAHPLRMRLLSALQEYGPATASGLADRLGESSGATSYHLRQLASYGFVEDDPGRGTAPRAVVEGGATAAPGWTASTSSSHHPSPEVRGALQHLRAPTGRRARQQIDTWLGTLHEWDEPWRSTGDLSSFTLRLTPELAVELGEQVHALIESYRGRVPEPPADEHPRSPAADGSASVRIHFQAFPRRID